MVTCCQKASAAKLQMNSCKDFPPILWHSKLNYHAQTPISSDYVFFCPHILKDFVYSYLIFLICLLYEIFDSFLSWFCLIGLSAFQPEEERVQVFLHCAQWRWMVVHNFKVRYHIWRASITLPVLCFWRSFNTFRIMGLEGHGMYAVHCTDTHRLGRSVSLKF